MLRLGFCGRVCGWVVLNQFGTRYSSLLLAGFKSRPEHSRTVFELQVWASVSQTCMPSISGPNLAFNPINPDLGR